MMKQLLRWVRGTAVLYAEGGYAEILLGDMTRNDIPFWSVFREDAATIGFTLPSDQIKRVMSLAVKRKIAVRTAHSRGLPQFLKNYRKRLGLPVGLALAAVILMTLHLFVWDIQVVGCKEKLSEAQVLEWLAQNGIKLGGFRFGINASEIENRFVLEHDSAVWMSINLKATTAVVEVQERTHAPKAIDYTAPTNIYAARDGQILSFTMMAGQKVAMVGEAVQAGDLLVTGEIANKHGGFIYLHADAIVLAKTNREISAKVPLVTSERLPTGRVTKKYALELFGCKLPLYFRNNITYNIYDTTTAVHRLRIGSFFALPFAIRKTSFSEITLKEHRLTEDAAKAIALGAIECEEKRQLCDVQIEDAVLTSEIKEDILYIRKNYTCIENIALQREITDFYEANLEEGKKDIGNDHSNGVE